MCARRSSADAVIGAAGSDATLSFAGSGGTFFAVILSWRNAASRRVWEGERPKRFRGLDFDAAIDLLLALNAADTLRDLSPLKSVGLHKLKGNRAGQWAMTVNGPWRVCFEFRAGDAYEVEIVDYHRG